MTDQASALEGWTCLNCGHFVPNNVYHVCGYEDKPQAAYYSAVAPWDRIVTLLESIDRKLDAIEGHTR